MTICLEFLSREPWPSVVAALLHTLWIGAVSAVSLFGFLALTPAHKTNQRYWISLMAILLVIAGFFVSWEIVRHEPLQTHGGNAVPSVVEPSSAVAAPRSVQPTPFSRTAAAALPGAVGDWSTWAASLWLFGATLMSLRIACLAGGTGRIRKQCRPLDNPDTAEIAEGFRKAMGIAREVRILVGERIVSPAAYGIFWPALLLPASLATGIPSECLRAALAHELAHIRRHDYLVNLVQLLVEALLFFNPAVWWISHRIRVERESCCDALADGITGGDLDYASALTQLVAMLSPGGMRVGTAQALGNTRSGSMLDRVRRIVLPGHRPRLQLPWPSLLVFALLALVTLAVSWKASAVTVKAASKLFLTSKEIEQIGEIAETHGSDGETYRAGAEVTLSGTIRTADGRPFPKHSTMLIQSSAGITGSDPGERKGDTAWFTAAIDYRGGDVYVAVKARGYAAAMSRPHRPDSEGRIENIQLVLDTPFSGQVRLVDEGGESIAGAVLSGWRLLIKGGATWPFRRAADREGTVTFADGGKLPFGATAMADGYQYEKSKNIVLSPDDPVVWQLTPAKPSSGVVVSRETGEAIADAALLIIRAKGPFQMYERVDSDKVTATSDKNGRFVLSSLRDDSEYALHIRAQGYGRKIVEGVFAGTSDTRIELGPPLYVRGTILGPLDTLAESRRRGSKGMKIVRRNRTVRVFGCSHGDFENIVVDTSGDEARFEIKDLIAGKLAITAGAKKVTIDVERPIDDLVIDMDNPRINQTPYTEAEAGEERTVVFRMQPPPGAPPVQGALRVWWRDRGESFTRFHDLPIVGNEAKAFVPVPGRLFYKCIKMLGYWTKENHLVEIQTGNAPLVVDVPVIPAGAIYGAVHEANGRPATGIMVSVVEAKRSPLKENASLGVDVKASSSPDDGISRFNATPLPVNGEYVIIAHRRNQYVASGPIKLTAEEPLRRIELQFVEGVDVSGQIVGPDDLPVRGCKYRLTFSSPYSHGFGGAEVSTGGDGRFLFEDVNPDMRGTYTIVLKDNPGWQRCIMEVKPDEGPLTVRLKPGSVLRGVVLDDETGLPVPEVEVYVIAKDSTPGESSYYADADNKTDREGRFTCTTLEPRRYVLHVRSRKETREIVATGGQDGSVEIRVR